MCNIERLELPKDTYTENHSYRVSVYAAQIASQMGLELLYKAARLTAEEYEAVQQHVAKGVEMLHPVGGSLRRIIPIILAHHDKFDGFGYNPRRERAFRWRRASLP